MNKGHCRLCNNIKQRKIREIEGDIIIYREEGVYRVVEKGEYRAIMIKMDRCPRCKKRL